MLLRNCFFKTNNNIGSTSQVLNNIGTGTYLLDIVMCSVPLNVDPYLVPTQCVWEGNNDAEKWSYFREVSCEPKATFMEEYLPPICQGFRRESPIFRLPFRQKIDHLGGNRSISEVIQFFLPPQDQDLIAILFLGLLVRESLSSTKNISRPHSTVLPYLHLSWDLGEWRRMCSRFIFGVLLFKGKMIC